MVDGTGRDGSSWSTLMGVPLEAVRLLKREPLLLTAVAAAAVLALVAVAGPDGGQVYAGLIAGLVLALGVLWAVLRRGGRHGSGRSSRNVLTVGSRARIGHAAVTATGDNDVRMGRRTTVRNLQMSAGAAPARSEPGTAPRRRRGGRERG